MSVLSKNWKPGFGTIFTWFAMDKNGKIAIMVNNCFGDIPSCVLEVERIDEWLDHINEYVWEESSKYNNYPLEKKGEFFVDMYSSWRYKKYESKEEIVKEFVEEFEKYGNASDANVAINRGLFEYFAVEGTYEGEDYPVGYEGQTKMGDYYRYLVPTKYASIEDFPDDLHHMICVSDIIDFTIDRVIESEKINQFFARQFCSQ